MSDKIIFGVVVVASLGFLFAMNPGVGLLVSTFAVGMYVGNITK